MKKYILIMILLASFTIGYGERQNIGFISTCDAEESNELSLVAFGDLMLHTPQISSAYDDDEMEYNFKSVFGLLSPIFKSKDYVIGNLETTLTDNYASISGYPRFRSPYIFLEALKDSGVNVLTTANNHSYDNKFTGVKNTIEFLDSYGIYHTGTYKDEDSSKNHLVIKKNNIKIGLLAYTYSTNGITVEQDKKFAVNLIDKEKMAEDISALRTENVDFIITSLHFGTEYKRTPDNYQKDIVDYLKIQGVDIILGSHPHVLQETEFSYNTKLKKKQLVIYSMGNFISNQRDRYKDTGVLFEFNLSKRDGYPNIDSYKLIPTWVDKYDGNKTDYQIIPLNSNYTDLDRISAEDIIKIDQAIADFEELYDTRLR